MRKPQAFLLSLVFICTSLGFLFSLINALLSKPSSEGWLALKASPYGLSALADYIVGSIFGAMFLYFRNGPPIFFISSKLIALASPIVGSPLPLLYVAYMLAYYQDIRRVFTPKTTATEPVPLSEPPANRRQTQFIALFFFALLSFFVGVCIWAFSSQTFADGLADFRREKWILATFLDNLAGLLLTTVYVVVREGGISFSVLPWILAFVFLGNAPTCVYVLRIAHQSMRCDISFPTALLSQHKLS